MIEKSFEKLFGSKTKVYLLRYLFLNRDLFQTKEIEKFLGLKKGSKEAKLIRKEIKDLFETGLLKKRKEKFYLEENFFLREELEKLVFKFSPDLFKEIERVFKKFRSILFLGLGGLFLENGILEVEDNDRLDILIVLRKQDQKVERQIEKKISLLEKFVGHSLNFAILSKKEFEYKRSMFDKFLENWFGKEPIVLIEKIRY